MKYIKKHKERCIVIAIITVLLILIGAVIYKMLVPSDNKYGARLDDIVAVDEAVISKIKEDLKSDDATEVTYNTNVKIMKFYITTTKKSEDAKKYANTILETLSEKVVNSYDIEIYLKNENSVDFPMIGYHSKSATSFSWVLNKAGDTYEE